jgi:hypothetical protein
MDIDDATGNEEINQILQVKISTNLADNDKLDMVEYSRICDDKKFNTINNKDEANDNFFTHSTQVRQNKIHFIKIYYFLMKFK